MASKREKRAPEHSAITLTTGAVKRVLSTRESAKRLKAELRAAFPGVGFSVRGSRGTAHGNVHVDWTDGPPVDEVQRITSRWESQGFDGMTDSTTHRRTSIDIDGVEYESGLRMILEHRSVSDGARDAAKAELVAAGYDPGSPRLDGAARSVANGVSVHSAAAHHHVRRADLPDPWDPELPPLNERPRVASPIDSDSALSAHPIRAREWGSLQECDRTGPPPRARVGGDGGAWYPVVVDDAACDALARESLADEHARLVHPDGSECPDGCDAPRAAAPAAPEESAPRPEPVARAALAALVAAFEPFEQALAKGFDALTMPAMDRARAVLAAPEEAIDLDGIRVREFVARAMRDDG